MRVEINHLTKRFGSVKAVDDLSFTVEPGKVTGFLGPNGAGKTTTLRAALDLIKPTAGNVTFDGKRYREIGKPMKQIGAALEASSFHPGRKAIDHLRMLAPAVGAKQAQCLKVLEFVGLADAAKKPVGQFSLGMRGRLGLAATLLGEPKVLLLDEPNNGLDPEGIAWMRSLLREMASKGCAVLISSHMLSEVQLAVDDVVIIAKGKLVHASPLSELADMAGEQTFVVPAYGEGFETLCRTRGWNFHRRGYGFEVVGPSAQEIGHVCYVEYLELHQLSSQSQTLESVFFAMTENQEAAS
ncbi:MAG: ATP-binding cassette domain-containing protein [Propionibacteriaceae bacterium]|nr:ATP-binding cassette domain-containing protein [Propionibacteriaceae bacterium]